MDMEITPDCPKCGGTGSVAFHWGNGHGPLDYGPCGECVARYDRTHCARCHERLGVNYLARRNPSIGVVRVCSQACADAIDAALRPPPWQHGEPQ